MTNEVFTRLAQNYTDTVYRVALNMLKSPTAADDVCQECFLRLWKSNKLFFSDEHARNWLIRVAINESKRILSSSWACTENIEDYVETLSFSAPEHSELFTTVMNLPQKYRIVIYLYYYEGYSTGEIAKMLQIPEATVRTRMRRARANLKQELMEADRV